MDAKTLRSRALHNISSAWGLSIGAAVMAVLLAGVGVSFLPDFRWTESVPYHSEWFDSLKVTLSASAFLSGPLSLLGLAQFIIGGVIEIGYSIFLLKQHDDRNPEFNDLFSQFERFGTGFAQKFLRGLYITLWSLLLVIPGIVAAYSYAMTPYILAENPDLTASEAIARSKEMMYGYRGDLFVLHLTFLGWDILAALTLNIGYLWLNPYKNAATAAFYRELQARHSTP